ncbi:hypothetical protein E3N88_22190 [Mikania micrantha]|uniref:Uncharacterized protein n=1 Tax=Mikania micrantha TaxID=192012 RepID=A0A5N6NAV3_9ASTR|nr:hypothetical protein E3N88_22190 [Mikania micrantha]
MNVGENRVQNGVLDCPESKNEEKSLSVGRLDSSRYAEVGLEVLRDFCGISWDFACRLNPIMELKVLIFELYLVNPCVAEQKTLIVLLVDTTFAGRIASPLGDSDHRLDPKVFCTSGDFIVLPLQLDPKVFCTSGDFKDIL